MSESKVLFLGEGGGTNVKGREYAREEIIVF